MYLISIDMTGLEKMWLAFGVALHTVFSAVVIVCNVVATPRSTVPRRHSVTRPDEEKLLLESFARGELDDDQYRLRREALRSVTAPPKTLSAPPHPTDGRLEDPAA
jgi:uncharacterized membrane protein